MHRGDSPQATAEAAHHDTREQRPKKMLHPILVMICVLLAALAVTYLVDAGTFERQGKLVVPGTYQVVPKQASLGALFAPVVVKRDTEQAQPASLVSLFVAIPGGLVKNAPLIVMVMFVGGMFGVMKRTGVIDAGIDHLLRATSGNIYIVAPVLMLLLGLGSTLLGFASEYIVIIPLVMVLTQRLQLSNLVAVAIVTVSSKIGYLASVTNPLSLGVAQPIAGVPLFSGISLRAAIFILFSVLGILHLMLHVRRSGYRVAAARQRVSENVHAGSISIPQRATLAVLAGATVMLIVGTREPHWHHQELAAFYVFVSLVIAVVGRLPSREAADAFIDGMKSMVLAALMIGLAASVELILGNSLVLDTVIHFFTNLVHGHAPALVANGLMVVEMGLDIFIPSASGKAAVSMPIIGPIAHLSGVSAQTAVLAFLLGGGLTNLVTPTSGILLAYLATARVGFMEWLRFILPLFLLLLLLGAGTMCLAVYTGY